MKKEDEYNYVFERLLVESDQEDAEEPEDYEETLTVPFGESGESESDNEEKGDDRETSGEWSNNVVSCKRWAFDDSQSGVDELLLLGCTEPIHFYEVFMTDVWDLIVTETNRYGESREKPWEMTTVEEMKKFIGLCLQMGIVRLPRLRDYWSHSPAYGSNPIGSKVMARERFEKLLTRLHLADNDAYDGEDKLYKVSSLIELINRNCKGVFRPGRNVCVDECFVPFKGQASSRKSHKKHKYGVRLFRLCSKGGYACRIMVYADKTSFKTVVPDSVVIKLMDDLLDQGRHLYTDDSYTSVSLAESLLHRKTHLIGTCGRSRKGLPSQVIHQRLSRGQLKAQQNGNGVMVLKWKNRKEVIMLSTLHDTTLTANTSRPQVIDSYNQGKLSITGEETEFYSPFIRRTSKWYIRLLFNLVTQTCLVNAWRIYCETVQRITLNDFRIQVYLRLIPIEDPCDNTPSLPVDHFLEETPRKWRRCVGCYRKLVRCHDSIAASARTKQVTTKCSQCDKYFCLNCFNVLHQKCKV